MSTCKPKLTLEEREIAILRDAVDVAEKRKGKQITSDPDVKKIISILEDFLKRKKLHQSFLPVIKKIVVIITVSMFLEHRPQLCQESKKYINFAYI